LGDGGCLMVMLCCSEHPFEGSDSFLHAEYNRCVRCQEVSEGCETCWGHIYIDEDHPGRKPQQVGLIKYHQSCCHVYLHAVSRQNLTSVCLK